MTVKIIVCDCCGGVPEHCICDESCEPGVTEREVSEEAAAAYYSTYSRVDGLMPSIVVAA